MVSREQVDRELRARQVRKIEDKIPNMHLGMRRPRRVSECFRGGGAAAPVIGY